MKPSIEHEIEQALIAGVSHPENLPFLLNPKTSNGQGILLVHGFGSTPREMRALADYLVEKDFTILGIRLPGHGTSPKDLANRRAEEWLGAAERGYQILQQSNLQVNAVGLSTGGLVLLQLSLSRPIKRLVLLSPFLRLKHPLIPFARLLSPFIPYHYRPVKPTNRPFYYRQRPLKGIAQLNRLRWKVKKNLPQITTPTLVLATKGDRTIYPGTAEELFEKLGCSEKNYYSYGSEVPHVLTTEENPCQLDVFKRTCKFLNM